MQRHTVIRPRTPQIELTTYRIAPQLLSRIADSPGAYTLPFALGGIVTLGLFYVSLAGLPWFTAIAGGLAGLSVYALAGIWRKIVDEIGMAQSLQTLNVLAGLLASPTVTWEWIGQQIKKMEMPDWMDEVLTALVRHGGQVEISGNLPQTVMLWQSAGIAFAHPEQVKTISAGVARLLEVMLSRWGTGEQEECMAILEGVANFAIPASVGFALVVAVIGFMAGLRGG